MTGEEAEITEGVDEEMESMRRVEQRVAEFAARRANSPNARAHPIGPDRDPVRVQIGRVTCWPGTPGVSRVRPQP